MSKELLIGSGNRDKAAELAVLLAPLGWVVKSLRDYPEIPEPEETGETFEENALLKARYYRDHFGIDCVADDSGLAVDALDGAPGVYSARYAGEGCTYADNNEKLLRALSTVREEQRTARFICCAAFAPQMGVEHTELGTVEGVIAKAAQGTAGFGYDPVFIPEGETRSFAEMTAEEKNAISHRGRAFNQLRAYLESLA